MDLRDSLMPGEYRDDENPLRLSNALIAGEPDDVEFMGCIANCNNRQGIDKRACEELCRTERLEREQREQRIDFEVAELLADVEAEMEEGAGAPLREVTGSEARRRAALRHNADVFQYLQPGSNLTAEERTHLAELIADMDDLSTGPGVPVHTPGYGRAPPHDPEGRALRRRAAHRGGSRRRTRRRRGKRRRTRKRRVRRRRTRRRRRGGRRRRRRTRRR